jgi:hypothetical protein
VVAEAVSHDISPEEADKIVQRADPLRLFLTKAAHMASMADQHFPKATTLAFVYHNDEVGDLVDVFRAYGRQVFAYDTDKGDRVVTQWKELAAKARRDGTAGPILVGTMESMGTGLRLEVSHVSH